MRHRRFMTALVAAIMAAYGVTVASASSPAVASAHETGRIAYSIGLQAPGGGDLLEPSDVYTIRPDGSGRRNLTHVPKGATAAMPSWSADGSAIAYESDVDGSYDIWAMDADGGNPRQITHDENFQNFEPSWSPDGSHIVFERCDYRFGQLLACDIETVDVATGSLHRVVGGHRYNVHPVYSPDGSRIAFSSDRAGYVGAIWLVDADGHNLHRLTAPIQRAFWPDWSPDGERVVYSDHCCIPHSNVWSVNANGTHRTKLTDTPAGHNNAFASFSPDGTELVMDTDLAYPDACCNDLVVQHADGSQTTLVTGADVVAADWGTPAPARSTAVARAAVSHPVTNLFSTGATARSTSARATGAPAVPVAGNGHPSAGRIVFSDFNSGRLFGVDPDGGNLAQLLPFDADHNVQSPSLSPDGTSLLYSLVDNNAPFGGRIFAANADGTNPHQLLTDAPGFRDYTPRYTPDGKQIVFSRCQPGDGVCAIWVMKSDGTRRRALTPYRKDDTVDFGDAVSPSGTRVAFVRYRWHGIAAQVFVIGLDGKGEHAVTPPALEATAPSFSPDGEYLVVTSQAPRLGSNIYSVHLDGSVVRRLTSSKFPNNSYDGSYSPSGRQIAFASDDAYADLCCGDLFVMNADGSGQHQVATGGASGVTQVFWGASAPVSNAGLPAAASRVATTRSATHAPACVIGTAFGTSGRCLMRPAGSRFRK